MVSDSEMGNPEYPADFLVGQALCQIMQNFPLATGQRRFRRKCRQIDTVDRFFGTTHDHQRGFGQNLAKSGNRYGVVTIDHRQENSVSALRFAFAITPQKIRFACRRPASAWSLE